MSRNPTPKEIFDNPDLAFLQSVQMERQYFERKEAPTRAQAEKEGSSLKRKIDKLQEKIMSTLSAFATSNREPNGGLFVLGIDDEGVIRGLHHLSPSDLGRLLEIQKLLENVNFEQRRIECINDDGEQTFIYLIYVAYAERALVCSADKDKRAWKRIDSNTIELSKDAIDQLKRDRGIIEFENQLLFEFTEDELDAELAEHFRQAVIEEQQLPLATSLAEVLFNKGVIDRKERKYFWTRSGYLFLSINPRRRIAGAYIRLVKVEGRQAAARERFIASLDRDFDGPLPRQITKTRVFLRQSAVFKTYEYRNQAGSLVKEPELPSAAWEEAIVNAVVHRSYAIETQPIMVIKYHDCLTVESPGSFAQPMPKAEFRVSEVTPGRSQPRNPKLMEWLRLMKDEREEQYVKQWREGTKAIALSMRDASKPEPIYRTNGEVTLTLENDIDALEARIAAAYLPSKNRFANLFPLVTLKENKTTPTNWEELRDFQRRITVALRDALQNHNWFIDEDRKSQIVAHKRQSQFNIPEIQSYVGLYPIYRFQVRSYGGALFLCIDYGVREKNLRFLHDVLRDLDAKDLIGKRAFYRQNGYWQLGFGLIRKIEEEYAELQLPDTSTTLRVFNSDILPELNSEQLKQVLQKRGVRFDLSREVKQRALSLTQGASRERSEKTIQLVDLIAEELFPLSWNGVRVALQKNAAVLEPPIFVVRENLEEPEVEFRDRRQTGNIAEGLTRYGSFKQVGNSIQLVLVCTHAVERKMEALVNVIQKGSRKYRGAGQTFGARFEIGKRVFVQKPEDYLSACQEVIGELESGKRWLFLVYAPENIYSRRDYNSPYYQVKRYLLEVGFPSQMVKETTVENPDWKDLNLALNIIAKCGFEPWVLNKPLAESDCFIGISYSCIRMEHGVKRFVGYANVFNNLGQWKFYKGGAGSCSFEERAAHSAELIRFTIAEFEKIVSVQNVHIHSTAKFSRQASETISQAARTVRPDLTLHFVHINTTHPVRLYDQDPQGDGSLPRGAYVITSPYQFYLSTTGYNLVQKALGTPVMLEVNVHATKDGDKVQPNLECIAQHLLSLTKLNWASTRFFCHEPITTKFAGDIAYLMNAFGALKKEQDFILNPRLEKTPWFL